MRVKTPMGLERLEDCLALADDLLPPVRQREALVVDGEERGTTL